MNKLWEILFGILVNIILILECLLKMLFPEGQDNENINYEDEFEEMKCIGRGNFGAAFLVKLKNTPDNEELYFIAKKVILG